MRSNNKFVQSIVFAFGILVAFSLVLSICSTADAVAKKPLPPQSKSYGKTLKDWQMLYWFWYLGGDQKNPVGRVMLLPLPQPEPAPIDPQEPQLQIYEGHLDLTFSPGTPFVVPVIGYLGERYLEEGVPDDDPSSVEPVIKETLVTVTLDGQPLLMGTGEQLSRFIYGPAYYNEPILYDEPQPRTIGGVPVNAVGVVWAYGLGFNFSPLSVGEHTLELKTKSELFMIEYRNSWTIYVTPSGQ